MKVLIVDNHDSFTYNLVEYVYRASGVRPDIKKNDAIVLEEMEDYDKIILSPGPGVPSEAGSLLEIIRTYANSKSILGICLGHQAIGEAFGAQLYNTQKIHHGIATETIQLEEIFIFDKVPNPFPTARYHSWLIDQNDFPEEELAIIAISEKDEIMGIQHKKYDVIGLQFHPESILSPDGFTIIQNWLKT